MDIGSSIPAVFALAVGWALNEVSASFRLRREDRRAAGPILSDLFEIRHQLVTLEAVKKELEKQFLIPAQGQLQLQNFLLAFMPSSPNLVERYEEAVSALALVDPIRAFRLRSQPLIAPFLAHLRGLAASDQAGSEFWRRVVEPTLQPLFIKHLEELIPEVALAHGLRTWWQARQRLKKPIFDESDRVLISDILGKMKAASVPPAGP
ncbi:MAG: hypothetical protein ACLQVM_02355 [Terriglobia bacterium]